MIGNKRLIAKIMDGDTVVMTIDQNLLSVEFGALDRGSLTSVTDWGIYVNRGSLSFVDNSGLFNNDTVNNAELLGYTVKFYLAYRDQENLIATFKVQSVSDFNEETKEVKLECVSKLENLQKLKQKKPFFPFQTSTAQSLLEYDEDNDDGILVYAVEDEGATAVYPLEISDDTSNLTNVHIFCPFFPIDSIWSNLTKICQASMCRIIEDEKGNAVITGSFPKKSPILIQPHNILGITSSEFARLPNCSISVTNRTRKEEQTILDGVNQVFYLNYGATGGAPISVSGGSYIIRDNPNGGLNISLSAFLNTPYQIWGDGEDLYGRKKIYTYATETRERLNAAEFSEQGEGYDYAFVSVGTSDYSYISGGWTAKLNESLTELENGRLRKVELKFGAAHFVDGGSTTLTCVNDDRLDIFEVPSNDLIQSNSYYKVKETPLAQHILREISRRYGNGIECFEIECLFNDYFYKDGSKAFDGQDLSNHFKKYDVIIPYVMKRGQTVPLRKNADGTPKKFRIIGISYSYDGLLRQKLQVQEERYDTD